jgi:signal transduction histidine kinase
MRRPTVRSWAWIIASLALASLLGLGLVTVFALAPQARLVREAGTPILPLYRAATEQDRDLGNVLAAAYRWIGTGRRADRAELEALLARAAPARNQQLTAYVSPRLRSRLDRVDSLVAEANGHIAAAVAAYERGQHARGLALFDSATADRARVAAQMAGLVAARVEDARAVQEEVVASAERARLITAAAVALALAFLAASVVLLRRRVIRPIARLHTDVRIIAGGDLAHRAEVGSNDEMGELARDVNLMTAALDARLRQHDRLAATGELAAGLAHELNNPLQVILAQAGHWDEHGTPEETREAMHLIAAHARRAGRVIQGLLAFVRAKPARRRPADLNAVVSDTLGLMRDEFRAEHVALDIRLAPSIPAIRADPTQIEQVVINLLANALHAASRSNGARTVLVETRAESDTVVVAVEDSGPGVPPDVRARIFDPFFTTKASDGGVGLGLSISAQIAHGHGGTLSLLEGASGGARFELRLPAHPAAALAPAAAPPPAGSRHTAAPPPAPVHAAPGELAGVRMLVADDEAAVRATWARYFTKLGARVTSAADGAEALDLLRANEYEAVILDLKMPHLSGWEVMQATQQERPELASRIVIVSGDLTGLLELGTAEHLEPWRLIEKPADLDTIRQAVARAATL